jgi:hypothetical protein
MSIWDVYITQKSSWDRLRGESLCERVGTLGDDRRSVLGLTTLGGNGAFEMYCVCIVVRDLVRRDMGIGKVQYLVDDAAIHGHWKTVGGTA